MHLMSKKSTENISLRLNSSSRLDQVKKISCGSRLDYNYQLGLISKRCRNVFIFSMCRLHKHSGEDTFMKNKTSVSQTWRWTDQQTGLEESEEPGAPRHILFICQREDGVSPWGLCSSVCTGSPDDHPPHKCIGSCRPVCRTETSEVLAGFVKEELDHMCQTQARGANLARSVVIFGRTGVGSPVFSLYILAGFVLLAVYVLCYSTYILGGFVVVDLWKNLFCIFKESDSSHLHHLIIWSEPSVLSCSLWLKRTLPLLRPVKPV